MNLNLILLHTMKQTIEHAKQKKKEEKPEKRYQRVITASSIVAGLVFSAWMCPSSLSFHERTRHHYQQYGVARQSNATSDNFLLSNETIKANSDTHALEHAQIAEAHSKFNQSGNPLEFKRILVEIQDERSDRARHDQLEQRTMQSAQELCDRRMYERHTAVCHAMAGMRYVDEAQGVSIRDQMNSRTLARVDPTEYVLQQTERLSKLPVSEDTPQLTEFRYLIGNATNCNAEYNESLLLAYPFDEDGIVTTIVSMPATLLRNLGDISSELNNTLTKWSKRPHVHNLPSLADVAALQTLLMITTSNNITSVDAAKSIVSTLPYYAGIIANLFIASSIKIGTGVIIGAVVSVVAAPVAATAATATATAVAGFTLHELVRQSAQIFGAQVVVDVTSSITNHSATWFKELATTYVDESTLEVSAYIDKLLKRHDVPSVEVFLEPLRDILNQRKTYRMTYTPNDHLLNEIAYNLDLLAYYIAAVKVYEAYDNQLATSLSSAIVNYSQKFQYAATKVIQARRTTRHAIRSTVMHIFLGDKSRGVDVAYFWRDLIYNPQGMMLLFMMDSTVYPGGKDALSEDTGMISSGLIQLAFVVIGAAPWLFATTMKTTDALFRDTGEMCKLLISISASLLHLLDVGGTLTHVVASTVGLMVIARIMLNWLTFLDEKCNVSAKMSVKLDEMRKNLSRIIDMLDKNQKMLTAVSASMNMVVSAVKFIPEMRQMLISLLTDFKEFKDWMRTEKAKAAEQDKGTPQHPARTTPDQPPPAYKNVPPASYTRARTRLARTA